ncbi:MAG: glycosyltransferase family 4 protein, partial [Patescibacteria group bacterium]
YFVSHVDYSAPMGIGEKIKSAGRMIYSLEAKRQFELLVQETKPDIVHIQNIYHHISPSILDVCSKYKIPVIQTVHDYKLICPNRLFCNGQIETLCKGGMYYKEVLHRCTQHSFSASALLALEMYIHKWMHIYDRGVRYWIAPSQSTKDILVEYGMPKERISVMYSPVDTTDIAPSTTTGKYLFVFGRLSEEKGIDVAIRAMKHLPKQRLIIAGEGPQKEYLLRLARSEGVDDRVEFLGFVKGAPLKKLIREANLVLMPSIGYEVMGYSMTEAMAASKAVLGSRIGGIPEVLGSVDKRLLFTPGNEVDLAQKALVLLSNAVLAKRLGQQSRSWVQKNLFPEDYYARLIELYKKAMKQK